MHNWKAIPVFFAIVFPTSMDGLALAETRNRTYDVHHYKLELAFEEVQKKVLGTVFITFSPLRPQLDSIVLDAVEMNIHTVSLSSGHPLRFDNRSPELAIYLDRKYSPDDTVAVSVEYSCFPKKGLYFIAPDSTNPSRRHQIWSQGEDMDNRYWFPCYDFPNDKASSEVIATVREGYTLVSNGGLIKVSHDSIHKTKTFHWRQLKPHVSYLIMIAAGEYTVLRDTSGNVPLEYYVYPDHVDAAKQVFAPTAAILRFFEEKFQYPYPWEKYAQVIIGDFMYGGMENTSAVTLNEVTILDERARLDFTSDDVIAHELAHQWWGDLVTCNDWSELWLNEGFANYCEMLFKKRMKGEDEVEYEKLQSARSIIFTEETLGRRPLVSAGSYDTNLYEKGRCVLEMLRNVLGEEDFWEGLRLFLRRHEYASVDTRDLLRALEDASGKDLDWFFEQWVFKAGHPIISVDREWDDDSKQLTIEIRQEQEMDSLTGVFSFPLEIECTTSSGRTVTSLWVSHLEETAVIQLDGEPLMVIVDKGQHVLKTLRFEKSQDEHCYQLVHADNVAERIAAARELRKYPEDPAVFDILRTSALHDSFWGVRREATISLGMMKDERVKETLFEVYEDRSSAVRGAGIIALEQFPTEDVAQFIESAAARESSYVVLGYCIEAMASVDRVRAFRMASASVDSNSYRDIVRRAALNALRLLDTAEALPYAIRYAGSSNDVSVRSTAFRLIMSIGRDSSESRNLVIRTLDDKIPVIRDQAIRILALWGGEDARVALEKRRLSEGDKTLLELIESSLAEISSATPD